MTSSGTPPGGARFDVIGNRITVATRASALRDLLAGVRGGTPPPLYQPGGRRAEPDAEAPAPSDGEPTPTEAPEVAHGAAPHPTRTRCSWERIVGTSTRSPLAMS